MFRRHANGEVLTRGRQGFATICFFVWGSLDAWKVRLKRKNVEGLCCCITNHSPSISTILRVFSIFKMAAREFLSNSSEPTCYK